MAAGGTDQFLQVAVDFDDILATGLAVQTIDVLGKHHHLVEMLFQTGNGEMGCIRFGATAGLFDLDQVFPGDIRPNGKYPARQRILNAHPLFRLITVVESTYAAIGWQPRVR